MIDKANALGIVRGAYIEIPDNEEFKLTKSVLANIERKIVDLPTVYEDTELLKECYEAILYLIFLDNYSAKKYEKLFYKLKERLNINEILDKYNGKETTFVLENEEYDAFSLIYALADHGTIDLEHENMEEDGVKVIL